MTVQELISILEGFNPDAEVRLAMQPSWAMEYTIGEVIEVGDYDEQGNFDGTVYLAEEEQLGYLPEEAQDKLSQISSRWSRD